MTNCDARQSGADRLDPERFASELRACAPSLRLVAASQAGGADADDVVQQAAIIALERLDRFEPGTDFRAWMSAIVRGVARNQRRSNTRRDKKHRALRDREKGTLERGSGGGAKGSAPRVMRDAKGVEISFPEGFEPKLRNAVESLGPLQSACLLLKSVHGHSYDEISSMLDVPAATARSHVFRARTRLLEAMAAEDDDG